MIIVLFQLVMRKKSGKKRKSIFFEVFRLTWAEMVVVWVYKIEKGEIEMNRITVILHPNETRVDIVLSGKRFNNEQYSHTRNKEPSGHEERMLKRLNNVIGIERARAGKSTLSLDIEECFYPSEYIPKVIEIVNEFVGPDYHGDIYVDNRRTNDDGEYDREGWTIKKPTTLGDIDIGVNAKKWIA